VELNYFITFVEVVTYRPPPSVTCHMLPS